jgi:hypothetical protein
MEPEELVEEEVFPEKDNALQRVLVGVVFLCLLVFLPVLTYLILHPSNTENGTVAGVSTDSEATHTVHPQVVECEVERQQDLASIDTSLSQSQTALTQNYQTAIAPYREAKQALTGNEALVQQEVKALDQLMTQEYALYQQRKDQLNQEALSQRREIEQKNCSIYAQ